MLSAAAAPGLACGEKKGGLMLAVTTDMLAPKDVNVVSVSIQVGPQIKYNFIGRVTPEGEVLLPATLAIIEPDDPNSPIRVRVIAFKETKPRVLRDVTTTSPRAGRIALLRIPLSFVNDSSATGALPADNLPPKAAALGTRSLRPLADPFNPYGAEVMSACTDPDQTMIDGACASSKVDSATLPDYTDELVFSKGDRSKCFAASTCFDDWRQAVVDLDSCTAPKGGEVTNVTLVTADGTGACSPTTGNCFVPVDRSDEGWRDEGDRVRLPKGVCKKLREGATLGFVGGTACAQKTPDLPVCTGGSAPVDGGSDAGDPGDGGGGVEKVAELKGAYGLAVFDDHLFYGAADGVFRGSNGETTRVFSPAGPRIGPWFIAQHDANTAFLDGTLFQTSGDVKAAIVTASAAPKIVNLVQPPGVLPRSVAMGPAGAWFAYTNGSGGGNVLVADFDDPPNTSEAFVNPRPITALAYAQNDRVWIGDEVGTIELCDATETPFVCTAGGRIDANEPAGSKDLPIEGIASPRIPSDYAFVLRKDGVFLAKTIGASGFETKRFTEDDLVGIDEGAYFPRGIAANLKCAFYASKRGLEYISLDGMNTGVLATVGQAGQAQVVSVVVPELASAPGPFVYFVARDSIAAGGGVYRVRIPAPCL